MVRKYKEILRVVLQTMKAGILERHCSVKNMDCQVT